MKIDGVRVVAIAFCSAIIYGALTFLAKGHIVPFLVKLGCSVTFAVGAVALWWVENYQSKSAVPRTKKEGSKRFDWGMHYFRAFAILTIMATHYAGSFGYYDLVEVALTSSTIYFLFISGYLCQYIDQKRREEPASYYKKKLLNVIAPFVVFSLVFGYMKGMLGFNFAFIKAMLCGEVQGQYWYIPFVSGLFLVSPFICRMSGKMLATTTIASFVLFLIFPFRPGGFALAWPHTFYLYTYFTVFYIIGFVYCRYKETIDQTVRPYWYVFLGGGVFLLFMLWHPDILRLKCVERGLAIGLQRFCFLVCALLGLSFLKDKKIWILDNLAKYSFTLYFIHFGFFAQTHAIHDRLITMLPMPAVVSDLFIFAAYVGVMLACAILAKIVLGKFSRSIIGS